MPANLAQRRADKSARRKRLLKQRRAVIPTSLAEKMRCLARGKLHCCLMQQALAETGISTVILARETESGQIAMAAFLVDAFALGIKDVMFDVIEPSDFNFQISLLNQAAPLAPVEPSRARKLVRDAAAYAASLGLRPHRGFVATEQLFGDVRAEDCSETFAFGHDGKPVYMVGPSETAAQIVRRLENMTERLGPGGFDLVIPAGDEVEEGADADS